MINRGEFRGLRVNVTSNRPCCFAPYFQLEIHRLIHELLSRTDPPSFSQPVDKTSWTYRSFLGNGSTRVHFSDVRRYKKIEEKQEEYIFSLGRRRRRGDRITPSSTTPSRQKCVLLSSSQDHFRQEFLYRERIKRLPLNEARFLGGEGIGKMQRRSTVPRRDGGDGAQRIPRGGVVWAKRERTVRRTRRYSSSGEWPLIAMTVKYRGGISPPWGEDGRPRGRRCRLLFRRPLDKRLRERHFCEN